MLTQVKEKARLTPIAFSSAPTDQASTWRAWYTFFKQQKGDFLKDGQLSFADMPNQGKTSLQTLVDWPRRIDHEEYGLSRDGGACSAPAAAPS